MADTVDSILAENLIAIGKGTGSREVEPAAVEFWRATYRKSIAEALAKKAKWKDDRRKVLPMAIKVGRTARRLAAKKITKTVAQKASKIIGAECDERGRGRASNGLGLLGRYCKPTP